MRKRLLVEVQHPDRPSRRESRLGAAGRREVAGQRDRPGLAAEYGVIRHRQIEPQQVQDETDQALRLVF
jgi:hypothetical protein